LGFGIGAGGPEAIEFLEGALEVALEGIETALEAGEGFVAAIEGATEVVGVVAVAVFVDVGVPEAGFGAAEAAENPLGMDGDVEESLLLGGIGLKLGVEGGGEVLEIGLAFTDDDLGLGVEAGLGVVEGGGGFARRCAGAGGFLGIAAIGFNLEFGRHRRSCLDGSRRSGGDCGARRGRVIGISGLG